MVNFTPTTEVVTTKAFSSYMVDVLCREDILSSEVHDSNQVFCTPVASETLFFFFKIKDTLVTSILSLECGHFATVASSLGLCSLQLCTDYFQYTRSDQTLEVHEIKANDNLVFMKPVCCCDIIYFDHCGMMLLLLITNCAIHRHLVNVVNAVVNCFRIADHLTCFGTFFTASTWDERNMGSCAVRSNCAQD